MMVCNPQLDLQLILTAHLIPHWPCFAAFIAGKSDYAPLLLRLLALQAPLLLAGSGTEMLQTCQMLLCVHISTFSQSEM